MNAPVNLTHDRYSVRSYGSRDMAMVYEDGKRYAGPCSWADANKLADHRNASDRRSRQQIEAELIDDDIGERPPPPARTNVISSVGDWQAEAQRRTR